jgi:short-subunit dehydrogenase
MKNIIIGGTRGLGQEIANRLQASGEETFVVGRSYDETEHGEGMRVDLSNLEEAHGLADKVKELGANAINFYWIAGLGYTGDFTEQKPPEFPAPETIAAVNFGNVLPAAQQAFESMHTRRKLGHFVVISSTSGYKARDNEAVYAATKHALVGFARSLGLEAERLQSDVQVALFMPGGMKTEFWDGNRPDAYDKFLDPAKVAEHIIPAVQRQDTTFYEEIIERGSL